MEMDKVLRQANMRLASTLITYLATLPSLLPVYYLTFMGSQLLRRSKVAALSLFGTHVFLTSVSLAHDAFGGGNLSSRGKEDDYEQNTGYTKQPDPSTTRSVTEFVSQLYSGNGVVPQKRINLANAAVFEASPVVSKGDEEIVEIYRAFYLFFPDFLSPPRCIHSKLDASTGRVEWTYLLHLRYFGCLEDMSLLVVHARYLEDNVVEIKKLEERWNGNKSLDSLVIWLPRRINGKLSWYFTSSLVPDKSFFLPD